MDQTDKPAKRPIGRPPGPTIYGTIEETERHLRFSRARAQALFRDEAWYLDYAQWRAAWGDHIDQHGRKPTDYALMRRDTHLGWMKDNLICETRLFQNRYRYLRQQHPDLDLDRVIEMTRRSIQLDPRPVTEQRKERAAKRRDRDNPV